MMNLLKGFLILSAVAFLTACGGLSSDVENKLNELKSKTESLDSLIEKEVDKVSSLDSLINDESAKIKKLDSLIDRNASKLDSFSKGKIRMLEKVIQ